MFALGTLASGALFSDCDVYRYKLWRIWDVRGGGRLVNFVMLNPSTADHAQNDPTVVRCINYARAWGYGGVVVTNLFAFRATKPKDLVTASDPVGDANDACILQEASTCALVVCAWGVNGTLRGRAEAVEKLLADEGVVAHAFGVTKNGSPKHPLYLAKRVTPVPLTRLR